MLFLLLLARWDIGGLGASLAESFSELRERDAIPVRDVVEISSAITGPVYNASVIPFGADTTGVACADHPVFGHIQSVRLRSVVAPLPERLAKQFVHS